MQFRVLSLRIHAPRLGKRRRFLACAIFLGLGLTTLTMAAKRFVMPHPTDATTFPAHDAHPLENVAIAIDPYDTQQKSSIFNARFLEQKLLPMLFIVSNSGSRPVALDGIKVELVLRDRSKISPANEDDIYRRLSRTPRNDSGASRLPLPIPPRAPKAGVSREVKDEMDAARFQARAVEPGGTQSGFFFFDLSETHASMAGAHLYVTGVRDGGGNELMFFDIPLDKYLAASGSAAEP
jgi:hypothetical protein